MTKYGALLVHSDDVSREEWADWAASLVRFTILDTSAESYRLSLVELTEDEGKFYAS